MNSKSCFIQNTALSSVEIDGDLVMISPDQTHFMSLNTTGKLIFDYASTPKSLDEMIAFVATQFAFDDADDVVISKDLSLFIEQLIAHDVLLVCDA